MTKVVPTIHIHIFQVSMPRKRPACIIAIMDNSRDLKTHTKRQLNERLNQPPQICSLSVSLFFTFDLENYRLILSLSLSLSLSFLFWLYRYFLNQPISSREIEYLDGKGHCPMIDMLARRMNSLVISSIVLPPFPDDKFIETMRLYFSLLLIITSVNRFCLHTSYSIEIDNNTHVIHSHQSCCISKEKKKKQILFKINLFVSLHEIVILRI
jgi:hypothetical protein